MHKGKLVFAQLKDHLPRSLFDGCVDQFAGSHAPLKFSHWDQMLCMLFAQLSGRESLRDTIACLRSHSTKLYHAGIYGGVARSTLADANESRDCRIFQAFALHLIERARSLYVDEPLAVELRQSVYAIDASTIELSLALCRWAPAANAKAAFKLHTQLDLRGSIPAVVRITPALASDASFLDELRLESGSIYVMDRGYIHFLRLVRFTYAGAFFVIRSMDKLKYDVLKEFECDEAAILSDAHIELAGRYTHGDYPMPLRRVQFHDAKNERVLTFLTNHFDLQAMQVAALYKSRWQVELFFKWIKQNLRIKAFIGESINAVKTQIWVAISAYVLVAIVRKRLRLAVPMHTLLQVLGVSLFERVDIAELMSRLTDLDGETPPVDQIPLFENISGH